LNSKEQKRLMVLNTIERGEVGAGQAAVVLGLSLRQVRRLLAGYRREGAAALVHGNRGRPPAHRVSAAVRERVVALARDPRYAGCNHTHFTELLGCEPYHLVLSRPSVRRILLAGGMRSPRHRRAPKHRSRRERMPQEGMLLQWDGSRHDWLEGRGPWLTLVGAIDDATGTVAAARFRLQEDAQGYLLVLRDILHTKGSPLAIYRDRHGIFERREQEPWAVAEELTGKRVPTQVGRALAELDIQSIPAHSPQAKGRIERLWGTFQDRLVIELRLAETGTLEEADRVLQRFLPRYDAQFGVPATQPGLAYRPLPAGMTPEAVCCFKYERTVANDNTITLGQRRLQLLPGPGGRSYARATVEIQEHLDGHLAVCYRGEALLTTPAPATAPLLRARNGRRSRGALPSPHGEATATLLQPPATAASDKRSHRPTNPTTPWRRWEYR